mgnify:CR=1 FL=1
MELIEISHPLKDHYLTNLRDKNTDFDTFRDSASKLSYFLVVEATKHLTTLSKEIDTPLTKTKGVQIENNSVAISVLRAGLGLMDGVQQLIPNISFGFEKTTNFDLKKLFEILSKNVSFPFRICFCRCSPILSQNNESFLRRVLRTHLCSCEP